MLWQLSQWTLSYSERLRERMPEQKETEQTYWRIEPLGWDAQERSYYVLDDNRLYRETEAPPPPAPKPKPKKNSKKAKAAARASKRRKLATPEVDGVDGEVEENGVAGPDYPHRVDDDLFGGRKWECLAVTLAEYQDFIRTLARTRDPNEKTLVKRLTGQVLPDVEKAAEAQQRKVAKRQRELLNLEKLATAKRSSRLAGKVEKQKEMEEAVEADRKRHLAHDMAIKEQQRLQKMEQVELLPDPAPTHEIGPTDEGCH